MQWHRSEPRQAEDDDTVSGKSRESAVEGQAHEIKVHDWSNIGMQGLPQGDRAAAYVLRSGVEADADERKMKAAMHKTSDECCESEFVDDGSTRMQNHR